MTLPWKAAQGLVLNTQVFCYFFLKGDWEEAVKVPSITFAGIAKSDGQLQPSTGKGERSPRIRTQRRTRSALDTREAHRQSLSSFGTWERLKTIVEVQRER